MAPARPQARHDQQTVVVRGPHLLLAVDRDQRVALGDQVAAAERPHERKICRGSGHDRRHLGEARPRLPRRRRQFRMLGHASQMAQQPGHARQRRRDRRFRPVLAGFHQQPDLRRRRLGEPVVVDQPPPADMAGIGYHELGLADRQRQVAALRRAAAQDQRLGGPQHRVQVEQHVHAVDQRPDLPCPVKLQRTARPVEHRPVPQPVHVLLDEARCGGLGGVEPIERGQVGEAEGQPAACRPQSRREQPFQHDRAGKLVAVHQGYQRHVRPRQRTRARGEAGHSGVAGAPRAEIGGRERHAELRQRRLGRRGVVRRSGHRPGPPCRARKLRKVSIAAQSIRARASGNRASSTRAHRRCRRPRIRKEGFAGRPTDGAHAYGLGL